MQNNRDIRWHQRLSNYTRALSQLKTAVELAKTRALNDLEKQGLIKAFEFTHELAWNLMKDYFEYQGGIPVTGSRDAVREAFKRGLVKDGDGWMEMIQSRNHTSHAYNQSVANEIAEKVIHFYVKLFDEFQKQMNQLRSTPS
jgi:nucleotidyltransferase substrate binding protein (TIGR01987 family)